MKHPTVGDLIIDYWEAKEALDDAKKRLSAAKDRILRRCNPGRYKEYTVYEVCETIVREHTRSGYKAVRWARK